MDPQGPPPPKIYEPGLLTRFKKKRVIAFSSLLGAVLILPLVVFVSLQRTQSRNFAATPSPTIIQTPVIKPPPATASPTPILKDTQSPTVLLFAPIATRSSKVTLMANASDNVAVAKVDFLVSGLLKCSDTTSPYSCVWDVPGTKGKVYNISATAIDTSGNSATSTISVIPN